MSIQLKELTTSKGTFKQLDDGTYDANVYAISKKENKERTGSFWAIGLEEIHGKGKHTLRLNVEHLKSEVVDISLDTFRKLISYNPVALKRIEEICARADVNSSEDVFKKFWMLKYADDLVKTTPITISIRPQKNNPEYKDCVINYERKHTPAELGENEKGEFIDKIDESKIVAPAANAFNPVVTKDGLVHFDDIYSLVKGKKISYSACRSALVSPEITQQLGIVMTADGIEPTDYTDEQAALIFTNKFIKRQ